MNPRQRTLVHLATLLGTLLAGPLLARQDGLDDIGSYIAAFDLGGRSGVDTDIALGCTAAGDGTVFLAGAAADDDGESPKVALLAVTPSGALDGSFGGGRVVISQAALGFPFTEAGAQVVAMQGDKVIVGGYRNIPASGVLRPFVLRLNRDGSIDFPFGIAGWRAPSAMESVTDLVVDPRTLDIWVLGPEPDASDGGWVLAKLDAQGNELLHHLVTAFSGGFFSDLELQPDGKLLLLGSIDLDLGSAVRLGPWLERRRASDGVLDPGFGMFGGGGQQWYDYGDHRLGRSVGVQPDGRLVIQGTFGPFGGEDLFVTGLLPDGAVDGGFGNTGTTSIAFDLGGPGGDGTLGASDMVVQSDGKIVVVARATTDDADNLAEVAVARLLRGGGADYDFGGQNTATRVFEFAANRPDGDDRVHCLTLAGGKAVIGGALHWSDANWDFALRKLSSSLIFSDGFELTAGFWSQQLP